MELIPSLLIVCPLVFFASLVDAIAGGGGLISLPAYLLTGMPAHLAIGSNKLSASIGTIFSTARFMKHGSFHLKIAAQTALFALIGSAVGAKLALLLSDYYLRLAMVILLPCVAIFVLYNKKKMNDYSTFDLLSKPKALLLSMVIGFFIGAYDGFFGPGTGTFLILGFTAFMGFDFKTACGNAKIVNLTSNLSSFGVFFFAGQIAYSIALPAACFAVAGHWIGSGLAIKKGASFIRPVLIAVLCLLFAKMIYDLFF